MAGGRTLAAKCLGFMELPKYIRRPVKKVNTANTPKQIKSEKSLPFVRKTPKKTDDMETKR